MIRSNGVGTRRVLQMIALVMLAGCDLEPDEVEESVAYDAEALSVSSWSAQTTVGSDYQGGHYGGAIATLNGVTYMVHSGDCDDCNELWWTKLTSNGWMNDVRIPSQLASDKVSLAAFNGYVYMVHTGDSDTTAIWVSRFDPRTEQWTPNYRLSYRSKETPAIAAYNGRLYMIGNTTSGTYQMWMVTMDTSENFSAQTMLSQWSTSRASLAVFNGRLYTAHRHQSSNTIVYNYFNGSSWEWNRMIPVGDGTNLEGPVPVIASLDGSLHLIVKRPGSSALWWTTYDGSTWASPVTLNTWSSYAHPGLGNGGSGLVLVTNYRCPSGNVCWAKNLLYTSQFTSPTRGLEWQLAPIGSVGTLAP